jgi:hypothetical protein
MSISTFTSGNWRQEPEESWPKDRVCDVVVRRDTDHARRLVSKRAQGAQLRVDLVKRRAQGAQQPVASFGRRNAPRRAIQEPNPEPCFEAANGEAQRGLRNAELCSSTGEAPLICNRDERQEVAKLAAPHS